jgi:hypothetical protein
MVHLEYEFLFWSLIFKEKVSFFKLPKSQMIIFAKF